MKIFIKSACIAFVLAVIYSMIPFQSECSQISDEVFRLHILANSDSDFDQNLKLKVRDKVLCFTQSLFESAKSKEEAEAKAKNLLEFGLMGSIYMEKVLDREDPSVGLVNNGTESHKGTTLTKEAYTLLKESDLNFIGNIETRELQNAVCDVIVTDGFTGNAIIKLTEGMGLMVLRELKKRFLTNTKSKLGALLLKDQLTGIKKEFNYVEYGGAPILGVKGALLKMHGSSDRTAVRMTILKAIPYVREDVVGTIEKAIREN